MRRLKNVHCIALYADFKNEVQTAAIFRRLKRKKMLVVYPRINSRKKNMEFFRVESLNFLSPGTYLISEPHPMAKKVQLDDIDLIVVPGVVFDNEGYRIGYGKGYYDRILGKLKAVKVGLAFEFQKMDRIPYEKTDQSLEVLITEKGIQYFH